MEPKKVDKYEQLLEKYNWTSPTPPAGYKYGVGRGAKAFITTAELSGGGGGDGGGGGGASSSASRKELELFRALDMLDSRKTKAQKQEKESKSHSHKKNGEEKVSTHSKHREKHDNSSSSSKKPKISMEDVAALMTGGTQAKVTSSLQLVKKDARTEAMEAIEDNEFSEDLVVVSVNDIYRSRNLAIVKECENILGMGSPDEQTTWITNARAYKAMGKLKTAHQTLVEGCQRTGKKGPLIWLERMRFLESEAGAGSVVDPVVRRQLAEEAVTVCPTSEELWIKLIDLQPIHSRQSWVDKAVIAIPESEAMWIERLSYAPTAYEQKSLVRRALKGSPKLPLLWAKLAHLESYEKGKQVFNSAGKYHPSLRLIVEAAKFEENHVNQSVKENEKRIVIKLDPLMMGDEIKLSETIKKEEASKSEGHKQEKEEEEEEEELTVMLKVKDESANGCEKVITTTPVPPTQRERQARIPLVDTLIHSAQLLFLNVNDTQSRTEWINVLREAAEGNYVATASSMLLYLVLPKEEVSKHASADAAAAAAGAAAASMSISDAEMGALFSRSLPRTWMDDIAVFIPDVYRSHALLSAVWYTILVIQQCTSAMDSDHQTHSHMDQNNAASLRIVSSALLSAPEIVLRSIERDAVDSLKLFQRQEESMRGGILGTCSSSARPAINVNPLNLTVKKEKQEEEEEEEELLPRSTMSGSTSTSHAASILETAGKNHAFIPEQESPLEYLMLSSTSQFFSLTPNGQQSHGRVSLVLLCVVESCVQRGMFAIAETILRRSLSLERSVSPAYCIALARVLISAGRVGDAYHILNEAVEKVKSICVKQERLEEDETVTPSLSIDPLYAPLWVKLAVLKRAHGENIGDFLEESLNLFPSNEKLWFMRIEDSLKELSVVQTIKSAHGASIVDSSFRGERIAQLKLLCNRALKDNTCRSSPRMWAFIAVTVSSEALSSSTGARALLLEASTTFVRNSAPSPAASYTQGRNASYGGRTAAVSGSHLSSSGNDANLMKWSAAAVLGLASARVELRHEGASVALQTVRETLRSIPQSVLESSNIPEHDSIEGVKADAGGSANRDVSSCVTADDAVVNSCWKLAALASVATDPSVKRERLQRRFVRCVGELVSLSIDLEAPAKRGQVASVAMRQWPTAFAQLNPLVLSSIAKLYFAASKATKGPGYARTSEANKSSTSGTSNAQEEGAGETSGQFIPTASEPTGIDPIRRKALEQAEKAVRLCRGSCGDALAVLLKIAVDPNTQELIVTERLGKTMDAYKVTPSNLNGSENSGSGGLRSQSVVSDIENWVLSFLDRSFLVGVPHKRGLADSLSLQSAGLRSVQDAQSRTQSSGRYDAVDLTERIRGDGSVSGKEIALVPLPSISPSWGPLWIREMRVENSPAATLHKNHTVTIGILRRMISAMDMQ